MRVLITGSTGFVGKNLIAYLERYGVNYDSVSRKELIGGDYGKLENCDVVVHLAGKAHDIDNVSNPDSYYQTNYNLTKDIYDKFLSSKAEKFIFISSVKAAADHLSKPLTEDFRPDPKTHYGKSKLMAEQYLISQKLALNKSYYILRPCMIHGPGNKGNLNLLYKIVSKNIPYPLAAFENRRSFLSVENLCFVINELINGQAIDSGVYHVADNDALSTNDLIKLISQVSGKNVKFLKVNKSLVRLLAKIGDLFRLPLTTERLGKLTENYIVDNAKVKAALGKDLPLSAKEGIKITVSSFQDGE